jgi:hypothetical protein
MKVGDTHFVAIQHFLGVLDRLEHLGLLRVGSLHIPLNVSDLDILERGSSFPSGMTESFVVTSLDETNVTVIPTNKSI